MHVQMNWLYRALKLWAYAQLPEKVCSWVSMVV